MTLVSTVSAIQTEANANNPSVTAEPFSVNMDSVIQPDDNQEKTVNNKETALQELFEQALAETGENGAQKFKWVGENEIQVDGLSGMTLHNFLLKAEALGKKVTYRRSIVFQIED